MERGHGIATAREADLAIRLTDEVDVLWAAEEGAEQARAVGLAEPDCWAVRICVSELAADALESSGGGLVILRSVREGRRGVEAVVEYDTPPEGLAPCELGRRRTAPAEAPRLEMARVLVDSLSVEEGPAGHCQVTVRKLSPQGAVG